MVTFHDYQAHVDDHKRKRREEAEAQATAALIPCDICKVGVSFAEYDAHVKAHEQKVEQLPDPLEAKKVGISLEL